MIHAVNAEDKKHLFFQRDDNDPDSDYINANYVDGYKQRCQSYLDITLSKKSLVLL